MKVMLPPVSVPSAMTVICSWLRAGNKYGRGQFQRSLMAPDAPGVEASEPSSVAWLPHLPRRLMLLR